MISTDIKVIGPRLHEEGFEILLVKLKGSVIRSDKSRRHDAQSDKVIDDNKSPNSAQM